MLRLDYQIVSDTQTAPQDGHCLYYNTKNTKDVGYFIPACGLLNSNDVQDHWLEWAGGLMTRLASKPKLSFESFDLFSFVFFCLSRYEEYTSIEKDQHKRSVGALSLAHQCGLLEYPIVDMLMERLRNDLMNKFNISIQEMSRYKDFVSTLDIDFPWFLKEKRIPLLFLKLKRQGWSHGQINKWKKNDPYDTYNQLKQWHQKAGLKPTFFFLSGKWSVYEKIKNYREEAYSNLIRSLSSWANTEFHASYASAAKASEMEKSLQFFTRLAGKAPLRIRMHYLRLIWPDTYRLIYNAGIRQDFTLCYNDRPGFRAGTSRPFYWYDLKEEMRTDLKLYPTTCMDVTYKNYMDYGPIEAFEHIRKLYHRTRKYNGTFVLLWHNSSLSEVDDWQDWKSLYRDFILEHKMH
jgi:hypothetical protein